MKQNRGTSRAEHGKIKKRFEVTSLEAGPMRLADLDLDGRNSSSVRSHAHVDEPGGSFSKQKMKKSCGILATFGVADADNAGNQVV